MKAPRRSSGGLDSRTLGLGATLAGPLAFPVTSVVVLAERAGEQTFPWKPGDAHGHFYEEDD